METIDQSQYREDSQGRLVPVQSIKQVDLTRDALVRELVVKAKQHAATLRKFKDQALDDIGAFCDLSAEKYKVQLGGRKGNVTLVSYCGRWKVIRAIQERLAFDERLRAAKALIDECLNEWSEGSRPEIRTLITDAFNVDKEGQIATHRVLSLRRISFEDPKWKRAMDAINDSLQVAVSKTHIRFYERDDNTGEYVQVTF